MTTRTTLLAALKIQELEEGNTNNIQAIRAIVNNCNTTMEFEAFVNIKHHRYGTLSYQVHRFYYLKHWVLPLVAQMTQLIVEEINSDN